MRSHGTPTRLDDRYNPTRTFLANPGTISWNQPGLSESHIRGSPELLMHMCVCNHSVDIGPQGHPVLWSLFQSRVANAMFPCMYLLELLEGFCGTAILR
ncbi:hypothetical protein BDQ94DRAFT_124568 [Aspergillus welwitschiae]|uniref:Uncharacterized protein n=1 Tax=Aspergillus welwitschiae TaxID=1341132 RepID=A0A3F3Q916_9EURO|nr:hypothetical protein BDQ94DRAFT_124568 [Aspergillus welwitschiae]RDH35701.1 hypothetical protein BDQ94DRAFT_124568 [Aspergillus welwitschiae]